MAFEQDKERLSKMSSLKKLVKEMHALQGEGAKPKAAILEVEKVEAIPLEDAEKEALPVGKETESTIPDEASLEADPLATPEMEDEEESEEPKDEFAELDVPEEEKDDSLKEPMQLPPELLKLLLAHLQK